MTSYMVEIENLLVGSTPKQKYEYLKALISENARAKGRIDFCKRQFEIIRKSEETAPYTVGYINSVIETLSTQI